MIAVEEEVVDTITAAFHYLLSGRVPKPIAIPDDLPDNEIRQLITYVNRFLAEFSPFVDAMKQLSRGELEGPALKSRMPVIHSLKALQSNLRHLTWKTKQIADGDLEQTVDFMGDFSTSFNRMTQQLKDSYEELERRNQFIRKTFGRYTSDDIVEALLDAPEGLELGGEKRDITLLMSDLRGFTALAERLEATEVVALLNDYLSAMVEPIQKHGGTIDEIIGDAIFVLFGAPVALADASERAALCALEMQNAMEGVNAVNRELGRPDVEMGIALHRGDVVVGNIGSTKRSKYAVVGRAVNLTARIESFTVGGQILVSPAVVEATERSLLLGGEIEVHAKGMREALMCRELVGHHDYPELSNEPESTPRVTLTQPVHFEYVQLAEKHLDERSLPATLVELSPKQAVIEAPDSLPAYANIMMRLGSQAAVKGAAEVYAKVLRPVEDAVDRYLIHFTSVPPGIAEWLRGKC